MTVPVEYHYIVKCGAKYSAQHSAERPLPVPLALFELLSLLVIFASSSFAQINGAPPSVTSPGFGGHAINGTPPSVTSLGRNGYAPFGGGGNFHTQISHSGEHHRHHSAYGNAYYPYVYALPVPYAMDVNESDSDPDEDESNYQGGPTIFDRRGSGRDSYIPPVYPGPAHSRHAAAQADSETNDISTRKSEAAVSEPPQPATTLVFKDGHQIEVENYAIVSQTLYDLSSGRPRKIALADLDIPATQKQNDDRGVTFQLPPSGQAN